MTFFEAFHPIFSLVPRGDGTGFGQSSDVMLIGPDRLNAAVNGSNPLQWLAGCGTCGTLMESVGSVRKMRG